MKDNVINPKEIYREKTHFILDREISVADMAKMINDETGIMIEFDEGYFGKE